MASPPIENPTGSSVGAVFLSYASQDAEVARRIGEALRAVGINVWLDESKLVGGDAWDATIRKQIKECALFLPLISAATQARGEGYFRLEWKLAVDRSHLMARDQAFLVPIVLDDTANATARVPDEFHAVQWTRITGGEIPATFPVRVKKLLSTEGSVSESGPVFAARSTTARRSVAKALLVGVLVVAIALWGAWYFAPRGGQAGDGLPLAMVFPGKSIAVLPFKPLVASHRDEVLEAGMADTLIAKLSMTREMIVPSLDSARRYDNEKKDSIAAGRALRVNAVLEGNLQKLGDRLRVNVRLIKVVDGTSMWSGTFEEKFTDVFAVQDAIAQKVATALSIHLSDDEKRRVTRRHTENTEAYTCYLKGRFNWNKYTVDGFNAAIDYYKQALKEDPNYALAYAGLASSYIQLGVDFLPANDHLPQAKIYALKALELDDSLAEAHCAFGTYSFFYAWDLPAAEKELKRAMALDPSYPDSYHFYCHWFEAQGRMDEAIAEIKRALALDPLSRLIGNELGWAYYHARRYDEAIPQLRKTMALDPGFLLNYWTLAQVYVQMGKHKEAVAELEKAMRLPGGDWPDLLAVLGCAFAADGNKAEAEKILQRMKERSKTEYINGFLYATIYVSLGDKDRAFEWLEKAIPERSSYLMFLKVEPQFDPLRSDPRFAALLRRIGL